MKKKLYIVLIIVLLFIPSFIALAFYSAAQSTPVTKGAVYQMSLTDIDGNTYMFSSDAGRDDDGNAESDKEELGDTPINFFIDLNSGAEQVGEIPPAVLAGNPYTAVYFSYNLQTVYKYYFTTDSAFAYFIDNKNQMYRINENDARAFIASSYAVSLYKDAAAPTMTVGTRTVLPKEMNWNYRLTSGQYSPAVVPVSSAEESVDVRGAINLNFDTNPDYVFVTVMQGENRIFNDVYANLGQLKLDENAVLTVAVTAQWLEDDDRGSYGDASYRFTVNVHAPAEFYLGATEILPGDFVAITGKNVVDPSQITFSAEPDIRFNPVFFKDDEYVVALVPISYELDYNPSYTFTIGYEGMTSTLTLNVGEKSFAWRDYDISSEIIASTRTQASIAQFNEALKPAFENQLTTRYWSEGSLFSQPCSKQLRLGIGIYRTLTATGTTYRHQGVDYMVSEGDQVVAACSGKVVYVGTQILSGRTIVIDHGFGLKTLYAHLNSTTVKVDDYVNQGDIIGIVGNGGFTVGTNLHFGTYIFDVPVSPYDAFGWEKQGILVSRP